MTKKKSQPVVRIEYRDRIPDNAYDGWVPTEAVWFAGIVSAIVAAFVSFVSLDIYRNWCDSARIQQERREAQEDRWNAAADYVEQNTQHAWPKYR